MSYNRFPIRRVDDIVFPTEEARAKISTWPDRKKSSHMGIYGPPGTGKSGTANWLALEASGSGGPGFYYERIDGAGSGVNEINRLMNSMINFAPMAGGNRVVLLDEADQMTLPARQKFVTLFNTADRVNEELGRNGPFVRIILTTNDIDALPPKIASRFVNVEMCKAPATSWLQRAEAILKAEGIEPPSDHTLLDVIRSKNGDGRQILNALCDIIDRHHERSPSV